MTFHFEGFCFDAERRELRKGSELVPVEPQVFDLLAYLIANRDHVVSKDQLMEAVWGGRVVSESTLTSRINAARRAIGDSGAQQRLLRTIARKGFRFVASVSADPPLVVTDARVSRPAATGLHQDIRFCTASDGVRIAYAEVGQGYPMVKAGNWLNHLEYDWESPIWSHLLSNLASEHRLIRYDARGNGLSDWEVDDISFEAFVRDLESVVEATNPEKFALLGISQGCAVCIDYAVHHPERVSHLILYGGFARGRHKRGSAKEIEKADALMVLMREGWGQENPAFRQLFTSLFIPEGSAEQMRWFNDLQRLTTSPQNAVRLRNAADDIDVSELLARVRVPTLVLHCRDDAVQPFEEGRRLAAGIPGSRFVALEGRNHLMLESEPAWHRFFDEVRRFIASTSRFVPP